MLASTINRRLVKLEQGTVSKGFLPAFVLIADGQSEEEIDEFLDLHGIERTERQPIIIISTIRCANDYDGPRNALRRVWE